MDILRYGLIGAGMMGREHARNLALVPGARLAAIADPDAGSCAEIAKIAPDIEVFADHRALLRANAVDALVIASPNDTHAAILAEIFAHPRALPVLVEKPLCTSRAQARDLARAAAGFKAPLWVGMEYRYMPPMAEFVRAVHGGAVGPLRMLAMREHRHPFLKKVGDWNRFAERTGGTLVEKCCHFFDLMRLIVRDEPVRVFASGAMDVNHRDERYGNRMPDILDNAFVIVDFRSGTRALLDLCMFADGAWFQEEFAATGDQARIEVRIPGPAHRWAPGEMRHAEIVTSPRAGGQPQRRVVDVDEKILHAGSHHGSTYFEHLGFQRAIVAGGPVEVTLQDGLKAVAIGLAAEQSARERRAIDVDFSDFA